MNEPIDILQTMNVREILARSYRLYKRDFTKLIGIILLLKGPYLIIAYIVSKISVPLLAGSMTISEQSAANFEYIGGIIIVEFLELIFIPFISPITLAAVTVFISERYLGKEISITESYKGALKRAIPLFGTVFITGVLVSSVFIIALPILLSGSSSQVASMLMIAAPVLSAVLWVWFAFVPQTVAIEGEGGFGAMKRSKYLISGHFRKGAILIPVILIAILIATWIFSYGFSQLLFFLGDNGALLGKGFSNIVSVLLEPFRLIIIPLLYFDIRVRKEGFNRDSLKNELESEL